MTNHQPSAYMRRIQRPSLRAKAHFLFTEHGSGALNVY